MFEINDKMSESDIYSIMISQLSSKEILFDGEMLTRLQENHRDEIEEKIMSLILSGDRNSFKYIPYLSEQRIFNVFHSSVVDSFDSRKKCEVYVNLLLVFYNRETVNKLIETILNDNTCIEYISYLYSLSNGSINVFPIYETLLLFLEDNEQKQVIFESLEYILFVSPENNYFNEEDINNLKQKYNFKNEEIK